MVSWCLYGSLRVGLGDGPGLRVWQPADEVDEWIYNERETMLSCLHSSYTITRTVIKRKTCNNLTPHCFSACMNSA